MFLLFPSRRCANDALIFRLSTAHFLARLGAVHGRPDATLDPATLHLFESYAWPGNVRELKNAIEHGLIFGKSQALGPTDFPKIIHAASHDAGPSGPLRSLEDLERDAIKATLEATRYKIGRAAEILGISRKTLLEKRKKYHLLEYLIPEVCHPVILRNEGRSEGSQRKMLGNVSHMKLRLLMLGKTRREEARALLDDYTARIRHYADVEVTELRDAGPAALRKLKLDSSATIVLLDAAGKQFTSQQFAKWLGDLRDRGTRELVFLCGDAEGFPADLRAAAKQKISLSTLTMPHEFARVVLAEQIYRAFAILAGHPYPK